MNTIATEQPSSVANRTPLRGKNFNLRAYFAGAATTAALIVAGVIIFGSLAAYVAFNGVPVGGGDGANDSVAVQAAAAAPQSAAAALGAAPGAVAATPATATAIAPAPGTVAGSAPGATGPGATSPTGTTPPIGTTPTGTAPTGTPPATTTPGSDSSGSTSSGPAGSAVQGLQDAAAGAGVDLPLTDATNGVTGPVDHTVQGTLNGAGVPLGNPQLGQQVGGGLTQITDQVLGN
jgi:hypothetical protein